MQKLQSKILKKIKKEFFTKIERHFFMFFCELKMDLITSVVNGIDFKSKNYDGFLGFVKNINYYFFTEINFSSNNILEKKLENQHIVKLKDSEKVFQIAF